MVISQYEVPDWVRSVLIIDPTDIWGNVVGIGLNELIAILSSAKRFDRRGNILLVDDFDNGLGAWDPTLLGTGAAAVLSTAYTRAGGFSCKLTTGSTSSKAAAITTYYPYIIETNIGAECSISYESNLRYFILYLQITKAGTYYTFGVRFDIANETLAYFNTEAAWTQFASGIKVFNSLYLFQPLKLVADMESKEYLRCLFLNTEYDLSACLPLSSATANLDRITAQLWAEGPAGANVDCYVESFIFTQNEP